MNCTPTTQSDKQQVYDSTSQDCGCGCMGQSPSKIQLQKHRDHLKVELKAVEKQLQELNAQKS